MLLNCNSWATSDSQPHVVNSTLIRDIRESRKVHNKKIEISEYSPVTLHVEWCWNQLSKVRSLVSTKFFVYFRFNSLLKNVLNFKKTVEGYTLLIRNFNTEKWQLPVIHLHPWPAHSMLCFLQVAMHAEAKNFPSTTLPAFPFPIFCSHNPNLIKPNPHHHFGSLPLLMPKASIGGRHRTLLLAWVS